MNTHRTSNEKERYTDAGEQPASQMGRVIGEFVSIANDFSRQFDRGSKSANNSVDVNSATDRGVDKESQSESNQYHSTQDWQQVAETLRQLREAAGDAIEGFANTLNHHDTQSRTTNETDNVVEAGSDISIVRQRELHAVFEGQNALEELSDEQFQQLLKFVRGNYESALELVKKSG